MIDVEGGISLKDPSVEAGLEEFDLNYSGRTRFDIVAGELLESQQKGNVRMKSRINGINMAARLRFRTVLRRVNTSP